VPLGEQRDVAVEVGEQDVPAELLERDAGVAGQPVGDDLLLGVHARSFCRQKISPAKEVGEAI
jgi:hypothetical protein